MMITEYRGFKTWSKETAKGNHEALKELEIKLGYWGFGLNNLE